MVLPEAEYRTSDLKKIRQFTLMVSESEAQTVPTTWRALCATQIFSKFAGHIATAVRLLPNEQERDVDVSVLAAIARIVIESHDALIYFTQRGLSVEERDFRLTLYEYHSSLESAEVLDRFGFPPGHRWQDFFYQVNRRALSKESFFQGLPAKEQKMLLNGRKAYYWRGQRPKPNFISESHESALYKLLSNHVHTFPLGASFRFGPSESIFGQSSIAFFALEALVMYSAATILAFASFRKRVGQVLSPADKKYLRDVLEQRTLASWLSQASATL